MREIEFFDIVCSSGRVEFRFCEKNGGVQDYSESAYFSFELFIPSSDTVALVLGTFCGTKYDRVHIDLTVCRDTFCYLKARLNTELTVKSILEKDFFENTDEKSEKTSPGEEGSGSRLIVNYSGGMDSLALHCCLPPDTNMVSILFEGFEREYEFFKRAPTHIVKTDVRRKLPIDTNSWEFMGFAAILYREYLSKKGIIAYTSFGTILEAGTTDVLKQVAVDKQNYDFSGLSLIRLTHGLTELGTSLVAAHYCPDVLTDSLNSLALPGSEKLYRKECLANIACGILGLTPVVKEYHTPRRKMRFGEYFATDFLSLCIAKHLGIKYVKALYQFLPSNYERFIDDHSLAFYGKIKQDMLSQEPKEIISFFCNKAMEAGLSFYTAEDYEETNEVREYLLAAYEETAEKERTTPQFQFLLDDRIRGRNFRKVVLYGAGGVGKDYYQQLTASGTDVYWVGENWFYCREQGLDVHPVNPLPNEDYEAYIIATIKPTFKDAMKKALTEQGIPADRIIEI